MLVAYVSNNISRSSVSNCQWSRLPKLVLYSGGGSNIRVGGGKPRGLGDESPPAGSRGGAPVGGLGHVVPQKLKAFRKICRPTKFGQI